MTMNAEIKTQWITALRSGDYLQAYGHLTVVGPAGARMCCLGVLCDLAIEAGVPLNRETEEVPGYILYDACGGFLPSRVMDWAGLSDEADARGCAGDVKLGNGKTLTELNDGEQLGFDEIAEILEADETV